VRWSATPPAITGKAAALTTGPRGRGSLTGARAGGGGGEAAFARLAPPLPCPDPVHWPPLFVPNGARGWLGSNFTSRSKRRWTIPHRQTETSLIFEAPYALP
jgi:hypothetical protein